MAEPIRRKRKGTAKELAKKLGVCERTVRNYVAVPRAEYEANSLSRSKPWEALGMSRASWYLKGKPTQAKAA
jgi:predicted transcriptional regulator